MKYIKILFLVLISLFFSCKEEHFYNQYVEIPNQIWNQSEVVKFQVDVKDISAFYNISIAINHNKKYEYGNLWLFAKVTSPNGKTKIDTIDLILIKEDNNWDGKCNNRNCKAITTYVDSIKFVEPGIYTFEFEQGVRKANLPNISKIGLIIDKLSK